MQHDDSLRRGAHLLRDGVTWKVKLLKDGMIHLERDDTGEVDRLSISQWQRECSSGATRMVGAPGAKLTDAEQEMQKRAFRDLPGNVRASGLQKYFFAKAFSDPFTFYDTYMPGLPLAERRIPSKSKRELEPFAKLVTDAFVAEHKTELIQLFERPGATARKRSKEKRYGEPVPAHFLRAPSKSTYCSWLTQWDSIVARNGQPDIRLLASRYHDSGPSERRMSSRVEEWLNDSIDTVWLTTAQNKKKAVFNRLKWLIDGHNAAHPDDPLELPSQGHVNCYIREEVDQDTVVRRRRGDQAADQMFKQVAEGPQATYVMEVVEVDHTRANVDVLDDITGFKLGRPWVTTALDRYSRLPVGVHVHFDGNSLGAVMKALRDVMRPKDHLREMVPDLDYDYPACGRPLAFFFDRGTDFDNDHVREVALAFDIAIDYEPVGCPQYKGRLERWHRTMQEEVSHPLPGATPPPDADGYRRDVDGNAYITFSDYCRRLMRWITRIYARTPHRTLRMTPLQKWAEGAAKRLPRPLPSEESLHILLNRVEYLSPMRGIRCNNLRWNGKALRDITTHPSFKKGQLVQVRIDDDDVSRAWVIDPFTRLPELLEPVFKNYMPGLTLYQHRMALLWSDERMDGARDEDSLVEARAILREEEDALLDTKAKLKKSNAAVGRHKNPKVRPPRQAADHPIVRTAARAAVVDEGDEGLPPMREVRKTPAATPKKGARR